MQKKSDCKGELKVTSGIMYACMHKIGSNGFPAEDKPCTVHLRAVVEANEESESSKLCEMEEET